MTKDEIRDLVDRAFDVALDNETSHPKEPLRFTHTDLSAALDWFAARVRERTVFEPKDCPDPIPSYSEELLNRLVGIVEDLGAPLVKICGVQKGVNIVTNAVIALCAWQFGNQISQFGKWDDEQERQDYCTKIAKKLHELLETERPRAS